MNRWPGKTRNAHDAIKEAIMAGRYYETEHAKTKMRERTITRQEIRYVLLNGLHAKRKDKFDEWHNTWKYAIEGLSLDKDKRLRIIVALTTDSKGDMAVLITVIDITK